MRSAEVNFGTEVTTNTKSLPKILDPSILAVNGKGIVLMLQHIFHCFKHFLPCSVSKTKLFR